MNLLTLQSPEAIVVTHQINEVGTLAADGWAVTFGTARRGKVYTICMAAKTYEIGQNRLKLAE